MQLHQISKNPSRRRSQRIGRGGKRGSYSGRGVKGQKSRAGRRLRPAVRDLIIRLPKRRGFRNKSLISKPLTLPLGELAKKLAPLREGEKSSMVVTREVLQKVGILPQGFRGSVKILGGGTISFPAEFQGLSMSKSVKAEIEKAGGKVME